MQQQQRTPEQHRVIVDAWRARNDNTDCDIIPPPPRRSASPRHSGLADELKPLLMWRDLMRPTEPLQTNWLVADNDNDPPDEDSGTDRPQTPSVECEWEVRPTPDEIMDAVAGVVFEVRFGLGKIPVGGDMESVKPRTGGARVTSRLGKLRFATEDRLLHDKDAPCRGSLLSNPGYRVVDKPGTPYGAKAKSHDKDIAASNEHFAKLLNAQPHRVDGVPANANDNRPALPCAGESIAESFLGCRVSGATPQPEYTASPHDVLANAQEAALVKSKLSPKDAELLDLAVQTENFAVLGESLDYVGKNAERQGKRHLLAVTKKLVPILQEIAA